MLRDINGKHFSADIWFKNNLPNTVEIAEFIVNSLSLNVVAEYTYNFYPGETLVYVLSESHLAIHTYPEYNYLGLDIYTCSNKDLFHTKNILEEKYDIDYIKTWNLERGNYN